MNEIYWITRFGALRDVGLSFLVISAIAVGVALILSMVMNKTDECYWKPVKLLKIFVPTLIASIAIVVFTPTTKQALLIYGVGGTFDYVRSNEKAKQLPDKVIMAIDKYLDMVGEGEKKKKNEEEDY